jgi:hypothetical protein
VGTADADVRPPPPPVTAERCNGDDDDGDGTTDEGCPTGALGAGASSETEIFGGTYTWQTDNTEYALACPAGQVVVGLYGRFYEAIDQLGARCGVPSIGHVASDPYIYTVTVAPGDELVAQGGGGGVPFDAMCPSGEVVIGVHLWTAATDSGASIYGLAPVCELPQVGGAIGGYTVTATTSHELDRIGYGHAGLTETDQMLGCGDGALVALTGWYGPWPIYKDFPTVNGVKGTCVAPTIPLIETQP